MNKQNLSITKPVVSRETQTHSLRKLRGIKTWWNWRTWEVNKEDETIQYNNYNPGHNILELYNILVQIWFTTSKKNLDI